MLKEPRVRVRVNNNPSPDPDPDPNPGLDLEPGPDPDPDPNPRLNCNPNHRVWVNPYPNSNPTRTQIRTRTLTLTLALTLTLTPIFTLTLTQTRTKPGPRPDPNRWTPTLTLAWPYPYYIMGSFSTPLAAEELTSLLFLSYFRLVVSPKKTFRPDDLPVLLPYYPSQSQYPGHHNIAILLHNIFSAGCNIRFILKNTAISASSCFCHVLDYMYLLVMGDLAKKKTIRFDSIQCHKWIDSIQFDSIRCSVRTPYTVHTKGSRLWSWSCWTSPPKPWLTGPHCNRAANCLCRTEWRHWRECEPWRDLAAQWCT